MFDATLRPVNDTVTVKVRVYERGEDIYLDVVDGPCRDAIFACLTPVEARVLALSLTEAAKQVEEHGR